LGAAIITGFIIFMGGGGDSGGSPSREEDVPTSLPQAAGSGAAPTRPAGNATARPTTASPKDALRARFPGSVIVTVTAYGMPARVGITAADDSQVLSRGVYVEGNLDLSCLPDQQYPAACVSYVIVKPGVNVTISAGEARAGPWPVFDSLKGPSCDQKGSGDRDVTCTATAAADMDFVATYYGSDTPNGRYDYPKCPASEIARLRASSPWAARCQ
jgi:hypothetical protein